MAWKHGAGAGREWIVREAMVHCWWPSAILVLPRASPAWTALITWKVCENTVAGPHPQGSWFSRSSVGPRTFFLIYFYFDKFSRFTPLKWERIVKDIYNACTWFHKFLTILTHASQLHISVFPLEKLGGGAHVLTFSTVDCLLGPSFIYLLFLTWVHRLYLTALFRNLRFADFLPQIKL